MAKTPDKPFDNPLRGRCGQRVQGPQAGATALRLLGSRQSQRFRPLLRLTSLVVLQAFLASNVAWAGGPASLDNLRNQASQENAVASGLEEQLKGSASVPSDRPNLWEVRGNEASGVVQRGGLEEGAKEARPGALTGWKKWASIAALLLGFLVSPAGGQDAAKPSPTLQPPAAVMVQQEVTPARPSLPKHLQTFAPVMGERLTVFYVRWYRPHPPRELSELQAHYKDRGVQVNFLRLTDRPARGRIQELPGGAVKRYQMSFSDFWRTLDTYQAADGRWYERDTRHFPRVIVMDFQGNLAQPDPSQLRAFLDGSLQTMERQEEAKRTEAERPKREEQEKAALQKVQEERQKAQAEVDRLEKEQQDFSAQTKRLREEIEPLRKLVEDLRKMPKLLQQEIQKLQEQKKQADQAVKELETRRSTVQEEAQKLLQEQVRLAKEVEEVKRRIDRIEAERKHVPSPTPEAQPSSVEVTPPSGSWPWILGGAALFAAGYAVARRKELASKARDLSSRIRRKAVEGRGVVEAVSVSPTAETEAIRQERERLDKERIRLVGEVEVLQKQKGELERQVATLQEEAKARPAPPAEAAAPPPPQTLDEAVVAVQTARANLQARIQQDRERLTELADRLERAFGQLQNRLKAELNPETMTVPELEERHRQQAESVRRSALAEERKEELLGRIQGRLDQAREERGRILEAIRQELEPKVQALADAGSAEVFDRRLKELQQEAIRRLPDEKERSSILDVFQGEIERHRQAAQDREEQEREEQERQRLERIEAERQQRLEALQRHVADLTNRLDRLQRVEDQEEFNRLAAELNTLSVPAELAEQVREAHEKTAEAQEQARQRISADQRDRQIDPHRQALQRIAGQFNPLSAEDEEEFNRISGDLARYEAQIPSELAEVLKPYLDQAKAEKTVASQRIVKAKPAVSPPPPTQVVEEVGEVLPAPLEKAKEAIWIRFLREWGVPEEVLQNPEKRGLAIEAVKALREKELVMGRLTELNLIATAAPAEPAAREPLPEEQGPAPPLEDRLPQEELARLTAVIGQFGQLIEQDRELASRNVITSDMQYVVTLPGQPVRWVAYEKGQWFLFGRQGERETTYPIMTLKRGESITSTTLYLNDRMSAVQVSEGRRVPILEYMGVPPPAAGAPVVEAGGFILARGEDQFEILVFPYKGYHQPGFFVHPGNEALTQKSILPDQPLSNQYEATESADPGARIFLGWHSHPEGEPQLGPQDEDDIRGAGVELHFELIFSPEGVALHKYWVDKEEIRKETVFSSKSVGNWLPSLSQFLAELTRRGDAGSSGQAQPTGLEEAAGVRPPVAGLLREPRFFTQTAEVPGSIYFFVDTREDSRTLRLAQLAAMVKAHEGWAIEFSGVAREAELDAAVKDLEGDIGSQVILENRILTYVTDAEYLDRRAEALRRLPEDVKIITGMNQETRIWFDEAIEAAGLSYMNQEHKRRIHAFLEAA